MSENSNPKVVSFEMLKKQKKEADVFRRWVNYYGDQTHEDLLGALVYEHENNFPLRSSQDSLDQLRHHALVQVLQERAHTEFLKSFLVDINRKFQN